MDAFDFSVNSSNYTDCILPPQQIEDDVEFLEKKKVIQWIAYRIIGPGVVGIGLLGNVLNLIVLTRPSLKGVTYSYLIGLACSDIGVLLCAVPMMIRNSRFERETSWPVAFFYSHLEYPMANSFMASSIFIVICLTVDRFISVCLPTRFKSLHTSTNSRTAILCCNVLAILISVPLSLLNRVCPLSDSNLYTFMENFQISDTKLWRMYIYTAEAIVRFGPAAILALLNFLIIWRFRKITKKRAKILSGGGDMTGNDQMLLRGEKISKKIYKEEKRLVTLLSAIVLLFFITTTPVAILGISYSETYNKNLYFQIFRAIANDLELCNFALNFYVYFLCSKEFRKKFLSFFTVLLPQKAKANFQSMALPEVSTHLHHHHHCNNKLGSPSAIHPVENL